MKNWIVSSFIKFINCIKEFYNVKNRETFINLLSTLKDSPHLFMVMDMFLPYKLFCNSNVKNVTYLINLFTRLYLSGTNFTVSVSLEE